MNENLEMRVSGCVQAFYELLYEMKGIDPLSSKIHHILCEMQPNLSLNAQKLLYLYFSFLNDGNTRIALDADKLSAKWKIKWDGLCVLNGVNERGCSVTDAFKDVIQCGILDICSGKYTQIFEERNEIRITENGALTKPFVIHTESDGVRYLYAVKYFNAKCIIEECASRIYGNKQYTSVCEDERALYRQFFSEALRPDCQVELSERQLDAIIRGQNESLIITGGPGTGKTTVICYLLWKLLSNEKSSCRDWNIYLAAPSGKAAERLRESILDSIGEFRDASDDAWKKIHDLEGTTLHRLLSYNPNTNQFIYNAENPFAEKSIFVVDEASMIDVVLFSKFMSALPKKDMRLFILGDADQLPSVDAGAVLGEILNSDHTEFCVKLDISHRFSDESQIGRLAKSIRAVKNGHMPQEMPKFIEYSPDLQLWEAEKSDQIQFLILTGSSSEHHTAQKQCEMKLLSLLQTWCDRYYGDLCRLAQCIDPLKSAKEQETLLNEVWNVAEQARILTAERHGLFGTQTINRVIREKLGIRSDDPFFEGQILMLTMNQAMFKLYNGDTGIVIKEKNSGRYHLLLRKVQTQQNSNFAMCSYVFYPISSLPMEALESAFAMTVHKSQGSGYRNIMMFLPQKPGHPLLNNQIIYTGVTRTKKESLTIISTLEAWKSGCYKVIERDTGISL